MTHTISLSLDDKTVNKLAQALLKHWPFHENNARPDEMIKEWLEADLNNNTDSIIEMLLN